MARTIKLTLDANVKGLTAGLRTAQKATADFANDVESWRKKNEEHLDAVGSASGKMGLAMAAGLAFTAKAAMDWESAWTGVLKTVDGTPEQLGRVEDGLRGLARELPSSHTEIAAVAEAAGQLGIQTDNVVGFTKVMIDLGESTNLGAEQAAMSLSRFMNIMGTSQNDVGKLGATLVGLGNNFATTESEIMDMSMRLAGAGKQAHLSEGQVMGLATAMSSVGIEAEAGGTAMSMILKKIGKAVDEGGESLNLFASTSGMSAEQFRQSWGDDASGTLSKFVTGLGAAAAGGESVNSILGELGIKGIRESDALLRLSAAGELVGSSMKQGAEEYDSGMALIEEANKRYATTESKIKMAWNSIKDAAIEAGGAILPVIAKMADGVADLATWFGSLPAPVHQALTLLGTIGATAGLGTAGLITMAKKVSELRVAMEGIYGAGGRATKAINGVGKALTGIAVVGAGLIIGKATIEAINEAARSGRPVLEDYFNLIATGGNLGDFFKENQLSGLKTIGAPGNDLEQFRNTIEWMQGLKEIKNPFIRWTTENLTIFSRDNVNNAKDLEEGMRGLARVFEMGEIKTGVNALKQLQESMQLTDQEVAALINSVPELKSALTQLATENGIQIDPNDELGLVGIALGRIKTEAGGAASGVEGAAAALEAAGVAADGAVDSMEDFLEVLFNAGLLTMNSRDAASAYEEQLDSVAESAKEIAKGKMGAALTKTKDDFNLATEAGRKANAEFQGLARAGMAEVEAMAKEGLGQDEIQKKLEQTYRDSVKAGEGFGLPKAAAEALTRTVMGIPDDVSIKTWMEETAGNTAGEIQAKIEAIPGYKVVQVAVTDDGTAGTVQSRINEVTGKTEYVFVSDDGTVQTVQTAIASIDGKNVPVYVTDDGTVVGTQKDIDGIKGKNAVVNVTASGVSDVENQLNSLARPRSASITLKAKLTDVPTPKSMQTLMGVNRASGGSVFGPGTETSDSIPAMLSNNEHVLSAKEVRGLGGHGAVERLRAMARNGLVPAFKTGGAVGRAEKRVQELQRAYSRIDGKKQNRARKLAAKDQLDAAKAELKAAKEQSKRSAEAAKEARERASRISEARFDLRRDLRRGEITGSFTSGSGMSVVDRLFEQSKNKDLSKGTRSRLRSTAYGMEGQLLRLEKRSDRLTKSLEKATKQRDDLLSAQKGVQSAMTGAFDLGRLTGQKDEWGYGRGAGKKGLLAYGRSMAAGAKKLSGKVSKLQKLGFHESMIQQVIDEWTGAGTFELADAMLSMNKSERGSFNSSYRSVERYGLSTGKSLTNAMSKGGIDAAQGLVRGLQSQQKDVDNAFYRLGKSAEKAFKRSLGIKSPSRVMMQAGVHVGEGAELGILSKVGDVSKAAERLMAPPALAVPPSPEVARYASAQAAAPSVAIDYDRLAEAMTRVQLRPVVAVGKNAAADIVEVGSKQAARRQ